MICLMFSGVTAYNCIDAYNKWARGKPLARDVIIHTLVLQPHGEFGGSLVIAVYFDEVQHPEWVGKNDTKA